MGFSIRAGFFLYCYFICFKGGVTSTGSFSKADKQPCFFPYLHVLSCTHFPSLEVPFCPPVTAQFPEGTIPVHVCCDPECRLCGPHSLHPCRPPVTSRSFILWLGGFASHTGSWASRRRLRTAVDPALYPCWALAHPSSLGLPSGSGLRPAVSSVPLLRTLAVDIAAMPPAPPAAVGLLRLPLCGISSWSCTA